MPSPSQRGRFSIAALALAAIAGLATSAAADAARHARLHAPMPGGAHVPAGARLIAPAEWDSLGANGQLGPAATVFAPRAATSPVDEPREIVPLADGTLQEIRFLSDTEIAADVTTAMNAFALPSNQQLIHATLMHASSSAPALTPGEAQNARAIDAALAHEIANRASAAVSKVWDKAAPAGSGCGTGVTGWGDGSDISGNKHHIEYSSDGLYANFDFPLKAFTPCVKDQAKRGTCTQFATLGAAEELIAEKYGVWTDLSEQATAAQDKIFWKPSLTGAESALLLLQNSQSGYVIPFETAWNYNGARKNTKAAPPGVPAGATSTGTCIGYHEYCSNTSGEGRYVCSRLVSGLQCAFASQVPAKHDGVRVLSFASLYDKTSPASSFELARSFLAMGYPVVFEGDVADHFNRKGGYMQPPMLGPHKRDGHAYNVVGYISNEALHAKLPNAPPGEGGGYFIVRNSWGLSYGDRGFGYMPVVWATKYVNAILAVVDAQLVD